MCLVNVFAPGCVTNIVAHVFDSPMLAHESVKVLRIGDSILSGRASGDDPRVLLAGALSDEVEGLPTDTASGANMWEVNLGRFGDPG
jgi:hypothetical protein